MKPDPWEHAEKDTVQAENLAAEFWDSGNHKEFRRWMVRADEHRKVARRVRRIYDRRLRREEEKRS